MRILVTNDDGIHAEGLAALERIAAQLSDDVWVVAPEIEQSGASRALTLTTPLRVRRLEAKRFAVFGTPTDCVLLAIQDLIEGRTWARTSPSRAPSPGPCRGWRWACRASP
jgi:5'-nucleotidase